MNMNECKNYKPISKYILNIFKLPYDMNNTQCTNCYDDETEREKKSIIARQRKSIANQLYLLKTIWPFHYYWNEYTMIYFVLECYQPEKKVSMAQFIIIMRVIMR